MQYAVIPSLYECRVWTLLQYACLFVTLLTLSKAFTDDDDDDDDDTDMDQQMQQQLEEQLVEATVRHWIRVYKCSIGV